MSMCYHSDFGRSVLNGVSIGEGYLNWGALGTPLGMKA